MQPRIWCDLDVLVRNARAWERFAGVPIRAVVKADGYRFGASDIVRALDSISAAYCVADADELFALRAFTAKPLIVLGEVDPVLLPQVLDAGGMATIGSREELAIATGWAQTRARALSIRVGVQSVAGWPGMSLRALADVAPTLAAQGCSVEVWTHLTDLDALGDQLQRLHEGVAILRQAGVRVTATDAASTFPAARVCALGDSVRIGIGLFGATGGISIPGVSNAIRVAAPVERVEHLAAGTAVGYEGRRLERAATVVTLRCGYSDGFPKSLAGTGDILAVGMQYTQLRTDLAPAGNSMYLIGEHTNLDELATRANRLVHEIVTSLGAARSRKSEA
jgi:alanine racemase